MAVELSNSPSPDSIPVLSGSLATLTIHDTPDEADCKIAELRAKVLETIRNHFPITTLFSAERKIDLGEFIKDQMLFRKIAAFLGTLPPTTPVDKDFIARQFEKSALLVEIKALLPQDPTPYLESLSEACADVFNKKLFSKTLFNRSIENDLVTLREALVVVQKTENTKQEWHRTLEAKGWIIPPDGDWQFAEMIKAIGESFIRVCLRIHTWTKNVRPTFKAELISTAEQLIPFVRDITRDYLWQYSQDCSDNPLTFRNPSGYNHHGLIAATIMEVCLRVLGYSTQVMLRSDLEPKVTLATAHSIVVVTAPDSSRYLVDPCYIQFHKDICLDAASLPTSPVLVLKEDEVDTYIEEKLMVHWRHNAELVKKGIESVCKKLSDQDQIITYTIDRLKIPPEHIPSNPEEWVRGALKRIWDIRTYTTIRANFYFHDIFVDDPYLGQMGIAPLSHYLPKEEVRRRLMQFLHDPKLNGKNSPEALSLIAQLPTPERRDIYSPLLEVDPRIQDTIGIFLNAYFCSLKKIVNPEGKDLSVIYGCPGPDCISVMLATDAQEFIFVDHTPLSYQEFDSALQQMKAHNSVPEKAVYTPLKQSTPFFLYQRKFGGAVASVKGNHEMNKLALKFFFNLKSVGVDLEKVILSSYQNENEVRVDFPWQYHGAASPRNRSVIFVTADITDPEEYPVVLKEKLKKGFDIFYMKAAWYAPQHYPQFLPHIAESIRPGGWLMTTDKSLSMEEVPPEKCLEQNSLRFVPNKSEEKELLENILIPDPTIYPFYSTDILAEDRHERTACPDLTYWSILNLRKRTV